MTRHMKAKRSTALILSAAMLATSLAPALPVYAQDGWTETQFIGNPVYRVLQDFSFSSEANAQALAAGSIPTGLSHNLTFTRHVPPYEPYSYGKYWLGNDRGQAVTNAKVPLASGSGNVTIDFSQIGNHFISCIQNHNGSVPGGAIPGVAGADYLDVFSSQWFAIEAFLPTDNPKDYPQYIQNSFASDPDAVNQMKFYLILMSLLHSYDGASEPDLKDDRNQTEYSAFLYAVQFLNFAKEECRSHAEEQVGALEKDLTKQSMDKMHAILRDYEERMREFEYLEQRDPMLAWCRLVAPECERRGEWIEAELRGRIIKANEDSIIGAKTPEARELGMSIQDAIMECRREYGAEEQNLVHSDIETEERW